MLLDEADEHARAGLPHEAALDDVVNDRIVVREPVGSAPASSQRALHQPASRYGEGLAKRLSEIC